MLRKFFVTAVAALVLSPALALAQPATGDWEITLTGSGANNKDFNAATFAVGGSFGYFLDQNMELSLRQTVGYVDLNAGTTWTGSTRGAFDYHFDCGQWRPFIGANIGYAYGTSGVEDAWIAGPEGGLKYYVLPKTFVFVEAEYQMHLKSKPFDNAQWVYSLGVGFNIGGKGMK